MSYETPAVEVIGSASELIQNYIGPYYDGDGYLFSEGAPVTSVESD